MNKWLKINIDVGDLGNSDCYISGTCYCTDEGGVEKYRFEPCFCPTIDINSFYYLGGCQLARNVSQIKEIETKAWILLALAGVATTLSTLFSFKALSIGRASYVTTIERSSLVIAVLLSVLFLKEKMTWQLIVGATLIIGGAILIALSDSGK